MNKKSEPPAIPQWLEWASAVRPIPGEVESGDRAAVESFSNGVAIAVIDGIGHGAEAARASGTAIQAFCENSHESPKSILQRCHSKVHGSRGVVMSVASLRIQADGTCKMIWAGIGNVEGVLLSTSSLGAQRKKALMTKGGSLGFQIPVPRESTETLQPGDLLILTTDGVSPGFLPELDATRPVQSIADSILRAFADDRDDALVFVARFKGNSIGKCPDEGC